MARRPDYPFVPKSTAYLEPGQFWAIPLTDGRFACGRVLAVPREPDPYILVSNRAFLAGLTDWVGESPPDAEAIAGARLIAQGFAHIKAITTTGGEVLGIRPLELDGIVPARWKSHEGGGLVWVYEGATRLHPITPEERSLPILSVWGYSVIRDYAERTFVGRPWFPDQRG
ncbi:MAG TPA: Imm26 family immunity protein [Candidatus Limnocylindrales bacterium]|nr:Imm26 family immunity protein [Candidatus Limnocylindrales bacterium]